MSTEAIESALSAAVRGNVVPGLTAAARLPNGTLWKGAYGTRGVADPVPMASDTIFWIASMTKALTSIAALQMVERGAIALDQPASDFIPAIAEAKILDGFDDKGEPKLREARKAVTLRHLLTHTSGDGYAFFSRELGRYRDATNLALGESLKLPRLFEAGERWQYGVGIDYAGQIVEVIAGKSLDIYLKENLFDILGMKNSTFSLSPEQENRRAAMHERLADGRLAPMDFPLAPAPNPMMGGGGLYSTAEDYMKFLTAILNDCAGPDGQRLLKPQSMAFLTDNHVGEIECGVLESSMPSLTNAFEPLKGVPKRWTLGMMRNETPGPHGRNAGSLAWAGLSNCYCWADVKTGVAGVILMQFLPFADSRALETFGAFEQAVYS